MNRRELLRLVGGAGIGGAATAIVDPRVARALPVGRTEPSIDQGGLQATLAAAIAKHDVPGASAAVFRDGKLSAAAAGLANLASGVEMTLETVMHIGSITKVFNTTLVMQLVDEGRIELDTPVRRYLPDFRSADRDAMERITVKMLLNHTSGIDGNLTPEAGHDQERIVDAIARIAEMGQIHAPGAELSYCNAGTVVAGYLVQRLADRSWYDVVEERIFRRLGMEHSVSVPEDALLHRASVGHFLDPATKKLIRTSHAFLPLSFAPAGATLMMSATDLVTFGRAHMKDGMAPNGHRLISEASARAMRTTTASFPGPGFADFGLGWMVLENGAVTHSGGGPGIVAGLYAHPASQTAVAVLTNAVHGSAVIHQIAAPIMKAVAGLELGAAAAELVRQATDAPVDPEPYVGQYENISEVIRVIPEGTGIAFTTRRKFRSYDYSVLTESAPARLRPAGNHRFVLEPSSAIGFLNPDSAGRMEHIAYGGRLLKRVG